jgi:hypothetical protein
MKQRPRIYYTETQKALMWDRWKEGDSLASIASLFDRQHSSIEWIIREHGGIRPAERSCLLCLSKYTAICFIKERTV